MNTSTPGKTLIYRVCHDASVDYSGVPRFTHCDPRFDLTVDNGTARFELKKDYRTEGEARTDIAPFVDSWVVHAGLKYGPGNFDLEFEQAEGWRSSVSWSLETGTPTVSVGRNQYPRPPTGFDGSHSDVQTLYERYRRYRQGKDYLSAFAYFCLTVLEGQTGRPRRPKASERYRICKDLLDEVGKLSSEKGGDEARKVKGVDCPLSVDERRFLEAATVRMIQRVAEYHGNGASAEGLPIVHLADVDH